MFEAIQQSIPSHDLLGNPHKSLYEVRPKFGKGKETIDNAFGGGGDVAIVGLRKAVYIAELAERYNRANEKGDVTELHKVGAELRKIAKKDFI